MEKIIIVAVADDRAIGKNQDLLWRLPNDMKVFRELTTGHVVVMGRKTFESLPKGALPNRRNIVLTRNAGRNYEGADVVRTMDEALTMAAGADKLFFIGGAEIYKLALPLADKMYLTEVHHTFPDADTFYPDFDKDEWMEYSREDHPVDAKHAYPYTFVTYIRK